jgi:hypothetical protein
MIRPALPIPPRGRGHAIAQAQLRGNPRAAAPGVAATLHERLCARLNLASTASSADVLAAVDARLARPTVPAGVDAATASLYARAFGAPAQSKPAASPLADLARRAGWGA